jgi:hypothetical protein
MENVLVVLDNQLKWAEKRVEEERGWLEKTIQKVTEQKQAIEFYESRVQEYTQAITILREHS